MISDIEIFWGSGSPFSWRVLLMLEIKKIPYISRRLDFSKEEQKKPEFLKINPRGKLPALREGNFTLSESLAIMVYLDRKFPELPFFGREAEEEALIWKVISDFSYFAFPATSRVILPIFTGQLVGNEDNVKTAAVEVNAELQRLDDGLKDQSWLAGTNNISAADIAVYPFIAALERAAGKEIAKPLNLGFCELGRRYPNLKAWCQRICKQPGYDKAYPPHWREAA